MPIDTTAQPRWRRTGYRFFPYAAELSGTWWVLRLNPGFPEHDMYTLFVDGHAAADLTIDPDLNLAADLAPEVATDVVRTVAGYVNYGTERDDACDFCSGDYDGMTRA